MLNGLPSNVSGYYEGILFQPLEVCDGLMHEAPKLGEITIMKML